MSNKISSRHYSQNYSNLQLQLYETHKTLIELNFDISLIWIPSHVDIKGNEKADSLAKLATTQVCLDKTPYFTQTEVYSLIDSKLLAKWQEYYDNLDNIKHYKAIEPNVSYQIELSSNDETTERLITRLRLGTAYTNRYLHKIKKHPNGHCDHYVQTPETISHFLLQCPHYNTSKSIINPTITSILTDPLQIDPIYNNITLANKKI